MKYVKVTDGAVTRFFDLDNPVSRRNYKELINNNTGYSVVVDDTGHPKEFTETKVKETLDKAREASNKKRTKNVIAPNRSVADEE